jgi:hypothetical protein
MRQGINNGWLSMSTPDPGRLTNPESWLRVLPDDLFHSLQKWVEGQGFNVTHQRWLTGGRSGGYVAVVTLTPGRGQCRGAVLKLLPPDLAPQESRGVKLAQQHSPPEFYRAHMVDTSEIDPLPNSGWWLHLQDMAHADLARIRPLAELIDDPHFADHCERVISTITERWNDGRSDPTPQETTVSGYLTMAMSTRMEQLEEFAYTAGLSLRQPQPEIRLPGRRDVLPNPLATLDSTIGAHEHVTVYTGNGHGDLHSRNVLMMLDTGSFRMIDYGRFSPETPVSRDPVKLILSIVERWLPDLAPASHARRRLADLIVNPSKAVPNTAVSGYLDLVRRVFDAASTWGTKRELVEAWHRQHLLVLAASALRTATRDDMNMLDRAWFFEVSALAVADLMSCDGMAHQGHWSCTERSLMDSKDVGDQFERWDIGRVAGAHC